MSGFLSKCGLKGTYVLFVRRDGKIISFKRGNNLVVDKGLNLAGERAFIGSGPIIEYFAIGSGNATPLPTDTELETEVVDTKTVATTVTVTLNQCSLVFSHTVLAPFTMREIGIFNAAGFETGDMFSRFLTQEVDLAVGDVVDLTWVLQITGA